MERNKYWCRGIYLSIKKFELSKKKSIILGSGGAARSVIQGLINLNLSTISVISRNKSSLDELIQNFDNQIQLKGLLNNDDQAQILIREADLIVNTTPVGMKQLNMKIIYCPMVKLFGNLLTQKQLFMI